MVLQALELIIRQRLVRVDLLIGLRLAKPLHILIQLCVAPRRHDLPVCRSEHALPVGPKIALIFQNPHYLTHRLVLRPLTAHDVLITPARAPRAVRLVRRHRVRPAHVPSHFAALGALVT